MCSSRRTRARPGGRCRRRAQPVLPGRVGLFAALSFGGSPFHLEGERTSAISIVIREVWRQDIVLRGGGQRLSEVTSAIAMGKAFILPGQKAEFKAEELNLHLPGARAKRSSSNLGLAGLICARDSSATMGQCKSASLREMKLARISAL